VIITEEGGRDPANVARLVALAELLGAPVAEAQTMGYMNFPSEHPLHAGYATAPVLRDADVVLLVAARGPWHPPSKGPADATIILADGSPRSCTTALAYRSTPTRGALDATLDGLLAPPGERRLDADAVARRVEHWAERQPRCGRSGTARPVRARPEPDRRPLGGLRAGPGATDATVVETTTTRVFVSATCGGPCRAATSPA
jgi:thiamine pyrophosphate-dependent acetolactate synthase large subunit-like protein